MANNEMRGEYPLRRGFGAVLACALMLLGTTAHAASSGVHLTPRLTSVEGGTSQIFSVRLFDAAGGPAAGETVTFTNDACGLFPGGGYFEDVTSDPGGVANISFTADPLGGVVCDVTATAGPASVRFEVVTYTTSQIEIVPATPATRPAPGQPYLLSAAVRMGQYTLYNLEVSVRVLPDQAVTAFFLPPSNAVSANTGQNGTVAFTVQPDSNVGTYDLELRLGDYTRIVTIYFNAGFNHQGLWWVGESENGWGVTVVQHGDKLFVVFFTYDLVGNPIWYAMPSGAWTTGGAGFTGQLYLSRGSPFHSAYNAAAFDPRPVGFAKLNLTDPAAISLEYTIDDISDVKQLTQFPFAEGPPSDPRFDDMWWGGESMNGQGVAVLQREQALFLLLFAYRDNGSAQWFSMPSGTWTTPTTYEGRIYRTVGWPWLGRVYLPERLEVIDVGSYRFRTLPNGTAALDYTIDGRSGSLALSRFPF
ncbi:hypothetical protein [Usitatibacter palustris]|uniref:Big-1 domain-containing protein n=1 Tax=Usitatibacter palustris TaxID=2732487 RepID=A0A6M4H2Q6_9PROT|nr:hypothetical protein [Usitatibacter palustris]QJR13806.1 hypothetical protein DSM104440_00596 [Usitatibacter palustris]